MKYSGLKIEQEIINMIHKTIKFIEKKLIFFFKNYESKFWSFQLINSNSKNIFIKLKKKKNLSKTKKNKSIYKKKMTNANEIDHKIL